MGLTSVFGHARPGVAISRRDALAGSRRLDVVPGSEHDGLDGLPGTEEAVQGGFVSQKPEGDGAGSPDDAARDQDKAVDEAPEFHVYVLDPVALQVHHHGIPRLDVPGQGGDDHVGPVADQIIHDGPAKSRSSADKDISG